MTAIAATKTPKTTSNVKPAPKRFGGQPPWDRRTSRPLTPGYRGYDTPLGNAERVSLDTSTPVLPRPPSARPILDQRFLGNSLSSVSRSAPGSHRAISDSLLLDKLRGAGMRRPHLDPELAGGLREWLEDSLASSAANLPSRSPVIRVSGQVLSNFGVAGSPAGSAKTPTVRDHMLRSLVRCLFRQWVTTRRFGPQPIEDALFAVEVQGDPGATAEAVNLLSAQKRKALTDEVAEHAARIAATWPVLSPAWYPRTRDKISIPLCGGQILLGGVVDLIIGAQAANEATVCLVQVDVVPQATRTLRADLPFYALLETLRAGASPSRVASYSTSTGELFVEPVDEDLLVSEMLKTIDAAARLCAIQAEAPIAGAGGPR
jgi:hypothetical protein